MVVSRGQNSSWHSGRDDLHHQSVPQGALIHKRISSRFGLILPGREEAFVASTGDGAQYVCKSDTNGRPVRATELICTILFRQLGIPTAACEILESDDGGETFFGSQYVDSSASHFDVQAHLTTPPTDEVGRPTAWLNRYLAQLYSLDLFVHNDDRSVTNFILSGQTLVAIDFAAAKLDALSTVQFPVAQSATVSIGKRLRTIHGFDLESALEMADRIAGLPANVVDGIVSSIPSDWLDEQTKRRMVQLWQTGKLGVRLDALRVGLSDGSLL